MTRIDAKFAALNARAKRPLWPMSWRATRITKPRWRSSRACRARASTSSRLGLPFTDPMADGPTIQLAGQRALEGGQTLQKTLDMVTEFRKGDDTTPDRDDGLLQPDLQSRRRPVSGRCQGGRDRRADRRRPAPRGRRRTVHPGAKGRAELHPPGDAHDRRQAPAQGADQHQRVRLLRLDHRDHRRGRGAGGRCRPRGGADQGADRPAGDRRLRHQDARSVRGNRPGGRRRRGRLGHRQRDRRRQSRWPRCWPSSNRSPTARTGPDRYRSFPGEASRIARSRRNG